MMVVMPVVLLLLFGYAINADVRHIPTLVDDTASLVEARSAELRVERLVRMGGRLAPEAIDLAPDILAVGDPGGARRLLVAALPEEAALMGSPRTDIQPRIVRAARARFLAEGVDGASLRTIAADEKKTPKAKRARSTATRSSAPRH
jgi:hypothetical protein